MAAAAVEVDVTAVWDGDGPDPWLPDRLAALTDITEAEQAVYRDYWSRLSGWLVQVSRAVLRHHRPDALAVWSLAPEWAREIGALVAGSITEAVAVAYRRLLGDSFLFDHRPAVTAYLAVVHNRMSATPDEVYDLIAGEIAEGANAGESIPKLAERVDRLLTDHELDRWPNRAVVVARTETIGALNAGRTDAFTAVSEVLGDSRFEHMWLATDDTRTRLSHREADGQRQPLGQPFTVGGHQLARPGDPTAPASEIIQCRCTTLLLRPGENVDLSNRQFTDW
ncbi:phage minor head protein [Micromonospora sp. WMMC273]|uniref:phage minor head protein n=1 Tax=Micromonospora sp. WMMC273 TaxID=3015157 RepID=UPI0022B642BD|nr:phage minor head protein [Micromonospora sp. WMMC273]MCZ7478909.1 phage minor head protein [Micromonospora sp. WMMC273]